MVKHTHKANGIEGIDHFGTHVGKCVYRLDGEVAALDAGTMAHIAAFIHAAGIVRGFFRIE